MKFFTLPILCILFFTCGTPSKKPEKHIIGGPGEEIESTDPTNTPEDVLPYGAARGNFLGSQESFYVYPKKNKHGSGMAIYSEHQEIPKINLPNAVATKLEVYSNKAYSTDILVATTQLEDPQFNKYHLYVFREGRWLPLVNGFAIHKSHMSDTLRPFWPANEDPGKLVRHYSVFDLDTSTEEGYTWRLLTETIPLLNR